MFPSVQRSRTDEKESTVTDIKQPSSLPKGCSQGLLTAHKELPWWPLGSACSQTKMVLVKIVRLFTADQKDVKRSGAKRKSEGSKKIKEEETDKDLQGRN